MSLIIFEYYTFAGHHTHGSAGCRWNGVTVMTGQSSVSMWGISVPVCVADVGSVTKASASEFWHFVVWYWNDPCLSCGACLGQNQEVDILAVTWFSLCRHYFPAICRLLHFRQLYSVFRSTRSGKPLCLASQLNRKEKKKRLLTSFCLVWLGLCWSVVVLIFWIRKL